MDFLLKEIDIVQANIARYDQNGMKIKNWCITSWGAATIYGFEHNNFHVLSIAPYIVLCFFMVEWVYRTYQFRFISHSATLEKICAEDNIENYRYSISSIAGRKIKGERMQVLKQPHFITLYLMLIVGSIISLYVKY